MTSWNPQAKVTIRGTNYTSDVINFVNINFGRTNIWEQARAGYCILQVLDTTGLDHEFDVNDAVTVTVKDSTSTDILVFSGKVDNVSKELQAHGDVGTATVITVTALAPLAEMARILVGGTAYPKEGDADRMTRILNEAGVTIETVDYPAVYQLTDRPASEVDAYSLATAYANMAWGYVYETRDGRVGYANESHRKLDVDANGYHTIPENYINWSGLRSERTRANIMNYLTLSYKANATVTKQDIGSQAAYGLLTSSIKTELEDSVEAGTNAQRYIDLLAYPADSVPSFIINMDNSNITDADRDSLIAMRMGYPIVVNAFPAAIQNHKYEGFVEGWNLQISRTQAVLGLFTTEKTLSVVPTRWQDVNATLQWSAVDPTLQWGLYE